MSSTAPEPSRREPAGEILRRVFGGALAASASCALIVASGHELATKLAADVLSGCLAALAVSPFVALVDSAVARSVANKSPPQRELWQSIVALAQEPLSCLYRADFYYTCYVYVVTYLTANICTTLATPNLLRLALITVANMWSGIRKDAFIARSNRASKIQQQRKVPLISFALFSARDVNAIGASFVMPRMLAPYVSAALPQLVGRASDVACQLMSPPICELVNTPIHLLALDIYNRPNCTAMERAQRVGKQYPTSVMVRIMRVLCAFSLGGISNRVMRGMFLQTLGLS